MISVGSFRMEVSRVLAVENAAALLRLATISVVVANLEYRADDESIFDLINL